MFKHKKKEKIQKEISFKKLDNRTDMEVIKDGMGDIFN